MLSFSFMGTDNNSGDWMASAVKHPGSFRAAAAKAGKSTSSFAREKQHAPGILGKRARLAMTFAKFRPKSGKGV